MADEQPPISKLMYGIKFRLQPNVNPAQRRKSQWNYTCCHSYCYNTCIHYKSKVKEHVERKHKEQWKRYTDPTENVPEEEDYVPMDEDTADMMQMTGELGADPALDDDDMNRTPQGGQVSLDGATPTRSTGEAAMQVSHIFCTVQLPVPVFSDGIPCTPTAPCDSLVIVTSILSYLLHATPSSHQHATT
jgi:hypothetical protein